MLHGYESLDTLFIEELREIFWWLKSLKSNTRTYLCVSVCVCMCTQSGLTLCDGIACQAPLSMEFSRQEYWSGLPFPPPGDPPNPGIKPMSPASLAWQVGSLPLAPPEKPEEVLTVWFFSGQMILRHWSGSFWCRSGNSHVTDLSVLEGKWRMTAVQLHWREQMLQLLRVFCFLFFCPQLHQTLKVNF